MPYPMPPSWWLRSEGTPTEVGAIGQETRLSGPLLLCRTRRQFSQRLEDPHVVPTLCILVILQDPFGIRVLAVRVHDRLGARAPSALRGGHLVSGLAWATTALQRNSSSVFTPSGAGPGRCRHVSPRPAEESTAKVRGEFFFTPHPLSRPRACPPSRPGAQPPLPNSAPGTSSRRAHPRAQWRSPSGPRRSP